MNSWIYLGRRVLAHLAIGHIGKMFITGNLKTLTVYRHNISREFDNSPTDNSERKLNDYRNRTKVWI
jgi:hypothetical protein